MRFPPCPAMGRPEIGPYTATERAVFNSSLHHHRYNAAESAKSKTRSSVHHRQLLQPHPFCLAQPDESHPGPHLGGVRLRTAHLSASSHLRRSRAGKPGQSAWRRAAPAGACGERKPARGFLSSSMRILPPTKREASHRPAPTKRRKGEGIKKGPHARAKQRPRRPRAGEKGAESRGRAGGIPPLDRFLLDRPGCGRERGPSGARLFAFLSPVLPSGVNSAHAPRRGCDSGCDIL